MQHYCPTCPHSSILCHHTPVIREETVLSQEPVKHSDDFKIVVVLDESGSMSTIRNDMIKSLNDLIREQKQLERPCKFTLVKFKFNMQTFLNAYFHFYRIIYTWFSTYIGYNKFFFFGNFIISSIDYNIDIVAQTNLNTVI